MGSLVRFDKTRLSELQALLLDGQDGAIDVLSDLYRLARAGDSGVWKGLAADAFSEEITLLPDDVEKLFQSFSAAHTAVGHYLAELRVLRQRDDALSSELAECERQLSATRWELQTTPDDDTARIAELNAGLDHQMWIRTDCYSRGQAIEAEVADAAKRFSDRMAEAHDLGIANRSGLAAWYASHAEIWVEAFTDAWDDLGPWVLVLEILVLALVPGGQIALAAKALLAIVKGVHVAAVAAEAVDIALSDDDADGWFFFEAGLTVVGLSSQLAAKSASRKTIGFWREAVSNSNKNRRTIAQFNYLLETNKVELAESLARAEELISVGSQSFKTTDSLLSGKTLKQLFVDPLWSATTYGWQSYQRVIDAAPPVITTCTLVDIVVDVADRSRLQPSRSQ